MSKGKAVAKATGKAVSTPATSKTPGKVALRDYKRTPAEQAAGDRFFAKSKDKTPLPPVKAKQEADGKYDIWLDHPAVGMAQILFSDAIGSTTQAFATELLNQVVTATCRNGAPDTRAADFAIAAIAGLKPTDEAEAMLAAQMAATHMLTMQAAARMHDPARTGMITQYDSALNAMTKLTRTFALQLEALKRYRTGGEQKVTVQHVHINGDGTQAVVSNGAPAVATGGGS